MARDKAKGRPPQQDRSRLSLERLLSSAMNLLSQRGYQDFTLQDVCTGAGLSVGAVYSRFASKEELLRMVQIRVINILDAEADRIVGDLSTWEASFSQLVPAVVREFAGLFRRHDSIIRPMMARAALDPIMSAAGQELDARMAARFRDLLLRHRDEISHRDPERAVDICFEVVFASVTRFLGLGTAPDVRGKGSFHSFADDLSMMASSFLIHNPGVAMKRDEKTSRPRKSSVLKKARSVSKQIKRP